MKKLVLVLGVLLTMSGLYADNAKSVEIINKATDDLRGIAVDDEECQKAILSFYTIVAKDSNRSISVTKEYKDCGYADTQNLTKGKVSCFDFETYTKGSFTPTTLNKQYRFGYGLKPLPDWATEANKKFVGDGEGWSDAKINDEWYLFGDIDNSKTQTLWYIIFDSNGNRVGEFKSSWKER